MHQGEQPQFHGRNPRNPRNGCAQGRQPSNIPVPATDGSPAQLRVCKDIAMPHSTTDHSSSTRITKKLPGVAYRSPPSPAPRRRGQDGEFQSEPAPWRTARTTRGEIAISDHAAERAHANFLWRHHYRCPLCQNDWAQVSDMARAVGSCPVCERRTSPYESEVCLALRP